MAAPPSFASFLISRRTLTGGASPEAIAGLRGKHPAIPAAVLDLLVIQDGENPVRVFASGVQFLSAAEIADAMNSLRDMVEVEELLPSSMLHFIPFLTTDVNSQVGVFTADSPWWPGHVAEWHSEASEICSWAASVEDFIDTLRDIARPKTGLGFVFPAEGKVPTSVFDLPGWSEERLNDLGQ